MHLATVHLILSKTLGLQHLQQAADTPLLGSVVELDSMAVANVITALEEHFGFEIHDDELSAHHFATLGSLNQFVSAKLA